MIKENVFNLLKEMPEINPQGEKVTLVAAVKLQTAEDINEAVRAGICDIGDNHVQEFKEKYDLIEGAPRRHFIGRLQTNKVKYLLGKTFLYHSVDRLNLAEELSKRGERAETVSDILLEINVSGETSKGGFTVKEVESAYKLIKKMPALNVKGVMTMLPIESDNAKLFALAKKARAVYDGLNEGNFKYLSMGMSGDWRLCIDAGSNMIRLGTAIFGARNYN